MATGDLGLAGFPHGRSRLGEAVPAAGVPSRPRSSAWTEVVCRRLESMAELSPEAVALLRNLGDLQSHDPGSELVGEQAPPYRPRYVVSGWAARVRWLADGRRQILGFVLPGDPIALCLRPSPLALAPTLALTPLKTVDAGPVLKSLAFGAPPAGLAEAVRAASAAQEALVLDHVMRLGRQTAYERMGHLLLEFRDRLADVGLAEDGAFALPLTQEMLADALGLSVVHVNRILQQLRREGLLDLRLGRAVLLDPGQLRAIADYQRPQAASWRA